MATGQPGSCWTASSTIPTSWMSTTSSSTAHAHHQVRRRPLEQTSGEPEPDRRLDEGGNPVVRVLERPGTRALTQGAGQRPHSPGANGWNRSSTAARTKNPLASRRYSYRVSACRLSRGRLPCTKGPRSSPPVTAIACSTSGRAPRWMAERKTYIPSRTRTRPRQGGYNTADAAAAAPRKPADGPASTCRARSVAH